MDSKSYSSNDIKVLEGLEAVRMRPGMYIGSTGTKGLHHLIWEIVDNAVDEAANGYADEVFVCINEDKSVTVIDNGRGMPVDLHPTMKKSGVEVIFTQLHAGGKFDSNSYSYSGGLHGVGASVVNALSEWLAVEVHKDGKLYKQRFESKFSQSKKKVISGKPTGPLELAGNTFEKGTCVTFKPDVTVFDHLNYNQETIQRRLQELAYLNKGLTIHFLDKRKNSPLKEKYYFEGGIVDFIKQLNSDKTVLNEEPILISGVRDDIHIEVAIQYDSGYNDNVFSYVNNIPTPNGGTHETGFKAAITKTMNDYMRQNGMLKEKDANLSGEDFREGMTSVIALKMRNIQFEGQTKTKLGNAEARKAVETLINEKLSIYLSDLKNADSVGRIIEKAVKSAKVRAATRKATQLARKRSALEGAPLVGKLSSCTGRKPEENELILVEGDSAGGSAKQARDRRFQAILPLRGKPLNAERKRLDAVLGNEEFRSIISALGAGIDADFDISKLKYHKIIILSDADQDGAHIRAILLTFFFRYMKELVTNGNIFIGQPPLYKVKRGRTEQYCYDDKALKIAIEEIGKGYTIQRYKGLGEMNPEQLWDTTLNPDGRKLIQVSIEDAAEADRLVSLLMGDKVEPRRDYIISHANFDGGDIIKGVEGA
ncbi:MAG: DNA topoisomerase subunit B [Eubacteriales bacterium]